MTKRDELRFSLHFSDCVDLFYYVKNIWEQVSLFRRISSRELKKTRTCMHCLNHILSKWWTNFFVVSKHIPSGRPCNTTTGSPWWRSKTEGSLQICCQEFPKREFAFTLFVLASIRAAFSTSVKKTDLGLLKEFCKRNGHSTNVFSLRVFPPRMQFWNCESS